MSTANLTGSPSPSTRGALEPALASWLRNRERSVLRAMVAVVSHPDVLSLAGGLPDSRHFPAGTLTECLARVLRDDGAALQYSPAQATLKEQVCELVRRRGIECRADEVLLTSGAQQGIDIAARMFLEPGGEVALERITYTGARQAVAPLSPRLLSLETDLDAGLDPAVLAEHLAAGRRPAFVYAMSDAHNPLGVSIAAQRREALADLARSHALPIVEDDPYGLLCYETLPQPLYCRAPECVLYLGSFSKILAPGLRLGWMIVPSELQERASVVKEACDLETSGLIQRAVGRLLGEIDLDRHLATLRASYRARRDALLEALGRRLGGVCRWTVPKAGMFVWLELPEGADAAALLAWTLERHRVAFIPGHAFAGPDTRAGRSAARLSFSTLPPEDYDRAVAAIAAGLEEMSR